jgi:hypothetical protein
MDNMCESLVLVQTCTVANFRDQQLEYYDSLGNDKYGEAPTGAYDVRPLWQQGCSARHALELARIVGAFWLLSYADAITSGTCTGATPIAAAAFRW